MWIELQWWRETVICYKEWQRGYCTGYKTKPNFSWWQRSSPLWLCISGQCVSQWQIQDNYKTLLEVVASTWTRNQERNSLWKSVWKWKGWEVLVWLSGWCFFGCDLWPYLEYFYKCNNLITDGQWFPTILVTS